MIPESVAKLLDGPCTGHLASLLPDGSPHSVPVWLGLQGEQVVFLTSPTSRKARNVAGDPRVAISLTVRDNPNTMAYLRGRVAGQLDGDPAWEIIDQLSHKYIGMPYPLREDRVIYLVDIDQAGSMSF